MAMAATTIKKLRSRMMHLGAGEKGKTQLNPGKRKKKITRSAGDWFPSTVPH
jgi:hypothetical protein